MKKEIIVFGGGCFWCTEAVFSKLKGVASVTSGYAGGKINNPNYYEVSGGKTQHAEVVKIIFYPKTISLKDLLAVFFAVHDPTSLNRQGNDIGDQYRSIIMYTTGSQKRESKDAILKINKSGKFENKVITEIVPLKKFYPAEEFHQNYFQKNTDQPYCHYVIVPKLNKLQKSFKNLLK